MSTARAAAAAVPLGLLLAVGALLLVVAGLAGRPQPGFWACGPAGTGESVAGVELSAEQLANAQVIVEVTAGRGLAAFAAVVATATAMQESHLTNLPGGDRDSAGLFQQRPSQGWGGYAQVTDPVYATNRFLDRLVAVPGWTSLPLTVAAQTVQRSGFPDAYARWAPLAAGLVGMLWPAAAATGGQPAVGSAPVCPGGGGTSVVGVGTTTVPANLTLTGTPAGNTAVRYALAQLGKPYVWGAAGPDAFDCSGLTLAAWAAAAVRLPHWTGDQVLAGRPVPLAAATSGDLVFIPGSDGTAMVPGHVGMVAGQVLGSHGAHLLLVEAPRTGDVVKVIDAAAWAGQVVAVRHLR